MRATATEVVKLRRIRAESNVSRRKHHVYPSGDPYPQSCGQSPAALGNTASLHHLVTELQEPILQPTVL